MIPMVHRTSDARAPQKKCGGRASRSVHERLFSEKVALTTDDGSCGYCRAISVHMIVPARSVQNIRGLAFLKVGSAPEPEAIASTNGIVSLSEDAREQKSKGNPTVR